MIVKKRYLLIVLLSFTSFLVSLQLIRVNATSPIEVMDCYWSMNGNEVIVADVGDELIAHIKVKAVSSSYQGTIIIKLIQDTDEWLDNDFLTVEKSLILSQGAEKEFTIPFISTEATGDEMSDSFGSYILNGYYIEVEQGDETIYKMENDYPPRLTITPPYWSLCVADASIDDAEKGSNNGGDSYLELRDTSGEYFGSVSKAYMKFDISALPENAIIDKAILKTHTSFIGSTVNVGAYYCSDSTWGEYSITWNNAPNHGSSSLSTTSVNKDSEWFAWDISSKFIELSSYEEETIVLISEERQEYGSYIWFHSKDQEYDWMKGYKPRIAIYWHEPKPSSSLSLTTMDTEVYSSTTIEARLNPGLSNQHITFNLQTPCEIISRTGRTDSSGKATITIYPEEVGEYSVEIIWIGNAQYEGSKAEKTFTASQTNLEASISQASETVIDEDVIITGTINPKKSLELMLVITDPESTQSSLEIESTNEGEFTYSFTPSILGEWSYHLIWEGDEKIIPYQSDQTNFNVIEPPPMGSAEITVRDGNSNPINQVQISIISKPQGQTTLTKTTSNQGTALFDELIVGSYSIKIEKTGYNTVTIDFSIEEDQLNKIETMMTQILSSLKIIVKDEKAKIISEATITSVSQPSGQSTLETTTENDGIAFFEDILPGTYEILATHEEYDSERITLTCTDNTETEKTIILEATADESDEQDASSGGIPSFPVPSILLSLIIISLLLKKKNSFF